MSEEITKKDVNIAKRIGIRKMVMLFTKLYNNLCNDCKRKVTANPKITSDKYCNKCREYVEQEVSKLQ